MVRFTCFGEAMLRYVPEPLTAKIASKSGPQTTSRWIQTVAGAELNVAVALAQLGWDSLCWVSVLPLGQLGDHALARIREALGPGSADSLRLVRREDGEIGIYHVWPVERRSCFQRRNSVFGLMDPEWFSEDFWRGVFCPRGSASAPEAGRLHVFSVTGITPLISSKARSAWSHALTAAQAHKKSRAPNGHDSQLLVCLDLNHRPALGSLDELWQMVLPHVFAVDLLVVSVDVLLPLIALLGGCCIPDLEQGAVDTDGLNAGVARSLQELHALLVGKSVDAALVPTLAVCCKHCLRKRANPEQPPVQLRWSIVCLRGDVVSTHSAAVRQQPQEELGGGDAWLAGVIDGLTAGESSDPCGGWPQDKWLRALRRGDMLAALVQEEVGDLSTVQRKRLDAALMFSEVSGQVAN